MSELTPGDFHLTQEEAQALYDAHDIGIILDDEEEATLLEESNPFLYDAYVKIESIANGDD